MEDAQPEQDVRTARDVLTETLGQRGRRKQRVPERGHASAHPEHHQPEEG